jgi:hypothetical protein
MPGKESMHEGFVLERLPRGNTGRPVKFQCRHTIPIVEAENLVPTAPGKPRAFRAL